MSEEHGKVENPPGERSFSRISGGLYRLRSRPCGDQRGARGLPPHNLLVTPELALLIYLDSANRVDSYLQLLGDTAQSMPEYRDSTTLIVATDHGRGVAPDNWKNHGDKAPDTKTLGERRQIPPVGQHQIAATLAALLGEDYASASPDVLPQ